MRCTVELVVHITNNYDLFLVFLSYIIALIAAFASIELSNRVRQTMGKAKLVWLMTAGGVLGLGIWSMHFIGMLAFHLSSTMYYDVSLVFLSIVASVAGCSAGFWTVSSAAPGKRHLLYGAILMGTGIASMHYIGMAAIRPMMISYDPLLVTLSLGIAYSSAFAALWLGFYSSFAKEGMGFRVKLAFSLFMGVAITGLHYTGMSAAHFHQHEGHEGVGTVDVTFLTWGVFISTLLIFIFTFSSIAIDRFVRKKSILQTMMFDSAEDGIAISDKSGRIYHANAALLSMFPEAHGQTVPDVFVEGTMEDSRLTLPIDTKQGKRILEVSKHGIRGEGLEHSIWFTRDITEKRKSEEVIQFMAYHDPLTELPNRYKLEKLLDEWIEDGKGVCCIFIDLDRLKFTNDTLGHQAGDVLLKEVTKRLKDALPEDCVLTRQGGDEFVVVSTCADRGRVKNLANDCVRAMNEPFSINGSNVRVTISAGIAHYPGDARNGSELLSYADLAMYESKKNGKNCVTEFNEEIRQKLERTMLLEQGFEHAFEQEEFYVLYQPKVNVKSGSLEGVEALMRWTHPGVGPVSPVEFIPIMEEKGMIHSVGRWVLREACRQWVRWIGEGKEPIVMGVNISPLQFSREDFIPSVQEVLDETGMDPNYLELELTESSAMKCEADVIVILDRLREMGIKISLDDFGTGYSSFRYLKALPVEILKIDRSFLEDFEGNEEQEAIVRSMITLGHNLNMRVLVEGVEDAYQMDWLKREGCDLIQGFYLSRPDTAEAISARWMNMAAVSN